MMFSTAGGSFTYPQDDYDAYNPELYFKQTAAPLITHRSIPACSYSPSQSPPSTMPSLSPANSTSSSFDSPCTNLESRSGDIAMVVDSRHSSPDSTLSNSSRASCSSTPATTPASSPPPRSELPVVLRRGQPLDRIKRPPNPYICFRSEFCKSKPAELERHNANVSKITGLAWRQLSSEGRMPYHQMAERKKAEFLAMHPDWVFKPRQGLPQKKERKKQERTAADAERYMRIALGFNSGKRHQELKKFSEAAGEVAGPSTVSLRPRRVRKTSTTKRLSAKAKAVALTTGPLSSIHSTVKPAPQQQAQTSGHIQSSVAAPAVQLSHSPFPPRHDDLQPDLVDFVYSPPVLPLRDLLYESALLSRDSYPPPQPESEIFSMMSHLQLAPEDSHAMSMGTLQSDGWINYPDYDYDIMMNGYSSEYFPY